MSVVAFWSLVNTLGQLFHGAPVQEFAPTKPNIVFIVADDLGWNDVGWNNREVQTPNMDLLAKDGVILNSSYVQPTCSPSRGALMTGYFPHRIGFQVGAPAYRPTGLPLKYKTLPERLRELGYDTHMVGKWHLGFCKWAYTPTRRGFDSFYGFYNGASDYFSHSLDGALDLRHNDEIVRDQRGKYSTELFAERAVKVIEEHSAERPLFLYLPFQAVHTPRQVPQRYLHQYEHIKHSDRKKYLGMVSAMDDAIGKVTQSLKDKGILDNTVIVFTTDNGGPSYSGANNWPLRGAKTTLWEGGTRGVAFVWSKLLKKRKYVNKRLLHIVDWYPTLVGLAGGIPDRRMDGIDQWDAISKNTPSKRNEFAYFIDKDTSRYAIRFGEYKLIMGNPGHYSGWYQPPRHWWMTPMVRKYGLQKTREFSLFNIRNDPEERINLASKKPFLLKKMIRKIHKYKRHMKPAIKPPKTRKADPKNFRGVWSPGWC